MMAQRARTNPTADSTNRQPALDSRGNSRMCVGCRGRAEGEAMVRFVSDAKGALAIDVRQKMPGRGAYLHLDLACIQTAVKRQALNRALGPKIDTGRPAELMVGMRTAVEGRVLERLGLARRAGAVAFGLEPVRRAMRLGTAHLVLVASDASQSTRQLVGENCRRKGLPMSPSFTGVQLGTKVGMEFVAALAVTSETFARPLTAMCNSLKQLGETTE